MSFHVSLKICSDGSTTISFSFYLFIFFFICFYFFLDNVQMPSVVVQFLDQTLQAKPYQRFSSNRRNYLALRSADQANRDIRSLPE